METEIDKIKQAELRQKLTDFSVKPEQKIPFPQAEKPEPEVPIEIETNFCDEVKITTKIPLP